MRPNSTELMDSRHRGCNHPLFQHAMAAEFRRIRDDRMIAHHAIVGDVYVVHQKRVIPDAGEHSATFGSAMDAHELTNLIVVTDLQPRRLPVKLQILRLRSDRSELENMVARANLGGPFDHGLGPHHGIATNRHVRSDHCARPHPDARIERRLAIDHSRGMHTWLYADTPLTSIAERSASAANSSPTFALPCIFHSGRWYLRS